MTAAIASRLLHFFERMTAQWDADWGIPESEDIIHQMGAQLQASDTAFSVWLSPTVAHYAPKLEQWPLLLRLASRFFYRFAPTPQSPADAPGQFSGVLAATLLVDLYAAGPPEGRFDALQALIRADWTLLVRPDEAPLAILPLTAPQMAQVLVMLAELTAGDFLAGNVALAAQTWAGRYPTPARVLVEQWTEGVAAVKEVAPDHIRALVEGVVQSTKDIAWRDQRLKVWYESVYEAAWTLALHAECFAVVEPLSAAARLNIVRARFHQKPTLMLLPALALCAREAREAAPEALTCAVEILDQIQQETVDERLGQTIAHLTLQAGIYLQRRGNWDRLKPAYLDFLDFLEDMPPKYLRAAGDMYLSAAVPYDPGLVIRFLGHWLGQQPWNSEADQHWAHWAPMTYERLEGPNRTMALLFWLGAKDPKTWLRAKNYLPLEFPRMHGFGRVDLTPVEENIRAQKLPRVGAWIYRVLASGAGEVAVQLVAEFIRLRPDVLPLVETRLLEIWPWFLLNGVRQTSAEYQSRPDVPAAAQQFFANVAARCEQINGAGKIHQQGTVWAATTPSYVPWEAQHDDRSRRSLNTMRKNFPGLIAHIPVVPLVRGQSMESRGARTQLKSLGAAYELPLLDAFDPLGANVTADWGLSLAQQWVDGLDDHEP